MNEVERQRLNEQNMFSFLVTSIWFCLLLNLSRMERQRREEELKNRPSKKALEAEQSMLNRVCIFAFKKQIHFV